MKPWARLGVAAVIGVPILIWTVHVTQDAAPQATASCYIGGSGVVDVTFNNPTSEAIQPDWVTVVTFGAGNAEDWSDSAWEPSGYPFGGYVIAAGQQVTYIGNDAAYAPLEATSCMVTSWRTD